MDWLRILTDAIRAGIGPTAAIYALAAIGLNIQFGYTGLLNYGQAGFLLVGAYGTAISADKWGLPLPLAFLVGILFAVALGALLGIPTLRLRADYLAIVTISAAEILRILANSRSLQSVTGGPQGIKQFANAFYDWNPIPEGTYGVGDVVFNERVLWVMLVTWSLAALLTFGVFLLMRSPWGRVLRAIREDEDAARSLGKNTVSYKMQSLILGGAIGGLAGIMLVMDRQFVEPKNFESSVTFFIYALLILGGRGRVMGPLVGSVVFWFLIEGSQSFLRQAIDNDFLNIDAVLDSNDVGPIRFMLVGLLIMLLVSFRPQGIIGDRTDAMLDE